ncbi:hypothetical protein PCANC_26928 [Puccinia coronata f. sp. avenae]|uniref:Uncharacterized protein n=1 Tax=Puccinia coronata f. sp. avenae TaxID=200324 RepID=A0A2N5TQM5_9BASI|nr:hypothetical protein PCANC_26928 [Puccinia coronata f. sp. avenae]PLW42257.1 hypothetical protein PCASD_07707 [Puccinia coronata f. sp. avenae]
MIDTTSKGLKICGSSLDKEDPCLDIGEVTLPDPASALPALPENLARMAASKFLSDAAIRFKLGHAPPSESLTDSNSVAKRPGR